MTTNRRNSVQIKANSRTIAVRINGHIFEGIPALIVITIIAITKLITLIARLIWVILVLTVPPVTHWTLRHIAGAYLAFRAFYTE